MHSQPRLKLPAERLPKLKNKNTSIRTKIGAITQSISIFTSSPDAVKHRKKVHTCAQYKFHAYVLRQVTDTQGHQELCILYLLNNSINTETSVNQVLSTEEALLILNYMTEFDLVSSDITVLSYLSYLHFYEES